MQAGEITDIVKTCYKKLIGTKTNSVSIKAEGFCPTPFIAMGIASQETNCYAYSHSGGVIPWQQKVTKQGFLYIP